MNNAYFRRATLNTSNSHTPSFSEQSIYRAFIQHQQSQYAKNVLHQQLATNENKNKDTH